MSSPKADRPEPLSPIERRILLFVAHGFSRAQIGPLAGVAWNTVKTYMTRLFPKLGARNMGDAVRLGYLLGMIKMCDDQCAGCAELRKLEARKGKRIT